MTPWWETFIRLARMKARAFLGLVPPKPNALTMTGTEVKTVLRYTFTLPAEPAIDDLAHREANVTVNSGTAEVVTISKGMAQFQKDFDRNALVSITLIDVDTSGNKSVPSDPFSFTATDTVPPPKPGGLSVAAIEQVP